MSYLAPSEFVTKMVDAGESKIFMSTRDTLIRAYMAGAILALAAVFAVTITVQTGQPIVGAILFPVGFCMLYLLGFDLLTGVFVLAPLALIDKRPGVTLGGVLRNWGLVFVGNFAGAFTVAVHDGDRLHLRLHAPTPDKVGAGDRQHRRGRTLGYAAHGAAGMLTLFVRGMLCNWMVSTGVVGAMISTIGQRQGDRDVDADHGVLLHDLRAFGREHVPVPVGPDAGRQVLDHGLLHLERDPDRARQPGRRPRLHRPDAVRHAREDRAEAQAATRRAAAA